MRSSSCGMVVILFMLMASQTLTVDAAHLLQSSKFSETKHTIKSTEVATDNNDDWQKVTVSPIKPGSTIQINVAYATNPRLTRMSPEQLHILLTSTQDTVKKSFGVKVEFTVVSEMNIERLFLMIPPRLIEARQSSIYDFKSFTGDKNMLSEGILTTLTRRQTTLDDALAFAAPYLPDVHPTDLKSFSDLLSDVMLERLTLWRHVNAANGSPVLDAFPYNEWIYWDALGYGDLQFDLVITNQLIASAEYMGVDIHTAIRGGLTVGTTSFSRNSKFGYYIFWSTFPFTDQTDISRRMRGGEEYSDIEAVELSGAYLAHEIGHMLFQFGHPFGQDACVMNPVSMLKFREWTHQINSEGCRMNSRAEMTPGAAPPYLNKTWLGLSKEP